MSTFQQLTVNEVCKLINSAEAKSCELDPIPSKLLKGNSRETAPAITEILNLLLKTGEICEELKQALLHPLLKKHSLELAFPNYRPMSNLPYLGKIIEWAVCNQITEYTGKIGVAEQYQSAYKAAHSIDTALVKVKTDILAAIDRKEAMCLTLLDMSTAFDTVNHDLLLNHLKFRFGITDTVLKWLESYLTGRHQSVIIGGATDLDQKRSDKAGLAQGIPQGSVLGPIHLTLYITPLGDICRKHGVIFHSYADDQQNYLSFSPANTVSRSLCLQTLENCIKDIKTWMHVNLLKLNDSKTEVLLLGTRQQLGIADTIKVKIGEDEITSTPYARNLSVFFNINMKWTIHINKMISNIYITLKKIAHIRDLLTEDATKTVVQTLVTSKLDYCNSVLQHTPQYNIEKLQRLQNMACRIVKRLSKYDLVSEALKDLHWLPIHEHIMFKTCMIMYKCITGSAPLYLQELVINKHNRKLCSSSSKKLPVNRCRTSMVQNSSFSSWAQDSGIQYHITLFVQSQ